MLAHRLQVARGGDDCISATLFYLACVSILVEQREMRFIFCDLFSTSVIYFSHFSMYVYDYP